MTRQTYRITVDVDDEVATIMTDVPGSLVRQIEYDSDLFDVVLVELVDTPKAHRAASKAERREAQRRQWPGPRIAELEQKVNNLEATLTRLAEQQPRAVIDVGEIVDNRLVLLDLPNRVTDLRTQVDRIAIAYNEHVHPQHGPGVLRTGRPTAP